MARGRLRIYLGAAPGVGKTFAMLNEGWRRAQRGTDVAVGYVETHGRRSTVEQLRDLEVLPRRVVDHRGARFEEMDVDAVLARRPEVALVDELAHSNAPGSRHDKRWRDIEELLAAGIDVISTVNVQHLESLNDVVLRITGITQRETVPDAVVRAADQIELVDMVPEALRRRMAHGNIYAPEKVDAALGNYFRVGNLTALRELALLWVADRVDESLQDYLEAHGISGRWETKERVVVAVTGAPSGEQLIRRAARMASRMKAELLGVHVRSDDGLAAAPTALLEEHHRLLDDLGGAYHEVMGTDVGTALTRFARAEHATQLVLGATRRSRWGELTRGSVITRVLREASDLDVHVITDDTHRGDSGGASIASRIVARSPGLSRRRVLAGWALTAIGLPVLTVALAAVRDRLGLPGDLMLYLLLVVAASAVGGRGPGLASAVGAALLVNWYFTPPLHTFTIARAENTLHLVTFLAVAVVVSILVTQAARRAADATRAGAEAEALARVAAGLVGEADPLPSLLARLRSTFDLDGAAVLVRDADGTWRAETTVGDPPPIDPNADSAVPLGDAAVLVLAGAPMAADDRRVLQAFAAQLSTALDGRRLRREADHAAVLTETDALRTALLRAVSHDLRSPLASIKASVTSLLQRDVAWSGDARSEFLTTIDEETDRLNTLVGNLLDMSRLQTGAVHALLRPVGWEEVVAGAVASLSGPTDRLDVRVPETLPAIAGDPALLERVVANVVGNALHHAPTGPVRVEAGVAGAMVDLRVVDRGPGIPVAERERLFAPFQRLGDHHPDMGVGLGLAVASGLVGVMGGELEVDDTPGGGLTMVIRMPVAVVGAGTGEPIAGPAQPVEAPR